MAKKIVFKDGFGLFLGGFLSNWFPCSFKMNGIQFSSSEQAFMHAKASQAGDTETMAAILETNDCAEQKRLGRATNGFIAKDWDDVKFDTVFKICLEKFSQNDNLKSLLLETGNSILVEASPTDVIWGIGLDANDDRCVDPTKWRGTNLLGLVLMKVRANLKG